MRRALALALASAAALALGACARPHYEQPRQAIPTVRYEPLAELPPDPTGAGVAPDALRKANEERLRAAKERFRDLDPRLWQGSGPWWLRYSSQLVHWVDGQTVLVGVGKVDPAEEGAAGDPKRLRLAGERARAEVAKGFRTVAGKVAAAKGIPLALNGELRLKRVAIEATFEGSGHTWALAICDRDCLEANGRAVRVTLAGAALAPGEP